MLTNGGMKTLDKPVDQTYRFLMPYYDLFTLRKNQESDIHHLYRSRFDDEEKCKTETHSACNEIEFADTIGTATTCKSDKRMVSECAKHYIEGKRICGVCMSVLYAENH